MNDLRLAVPAVVAWGVTAVVVGAPDFITPVLAVLWLAAGGGAALVLLRARLAVLAPAALCCAAAAVCCTSLAVQLPARAPLDPVPAGRVTVLATTTAPLHAGDDRVRIEVTEIVERGERTVGAVPVLAFVDAADESVDLGATVELSGQLRATGPGESVSYLLFADGEVAIRAQPPWYLGWANDLRARFAAACERLPGNGGDLLAGLAIGDTSAVSDELDANMKTSSLSHLTAVSGANCAIVIGLVLVAGAALGVARWVRICGALTVLVAFVVLVTPEPSVLRAAVMAAVVLAAVWSGRPVRGIPVLAVATMALLVMDPWLAREYGFVLSVLATGGLIALSGPLAARLERFIPPKLALVIAVPVAAQIACQPVIILLNASLPTYGVVANVLAEPAAPLATVVGLAGCVLLAVVPPLGELLVHLAWLPSSWIAAVATFFAAAPAAQLPWPQGWPGAVLLAALTVLALLAFSRSWARWMLGAAIAVTIAVISAGAVVDRVTRPADWIYAMCEVGQGDATLVRSNGVVALIDTGPDPAPLSDCLTDLGVDHIDLLVLTHFDLDHVGGVDAVVGRATDVLVGPRDGSRGDAIVASLEAAGARVETAARGDAGLIGDYRWTVLWPERQPRGIEPGNDASVTIGVDPIGECLRGCPSAILLGDLGESAQDRVLAANRLREFDVVKVSHHGSADQSERLYARVRGVVGLIGVGADNGYGHPTDRALDILARSGTSVLRTDRDGLILVAPGERAGEMTVWTRR